MVFKTEAGVSAQQSAAYTDNIYKYIVQKFEESMGRIIFANALFFIMNISFALMKDDYNHFTENKKGYFSADHPGIGKTIL
jgi:hypothetical protein